MIFVERIRIPRVLIRNGSKWKEEILSAKSKFNSSNNKTDRAILDKALSKYHHDEIKKSLELMFYGKCAFCESYIQNVDFGDIEHFKPKSKFPELAVEWNNLLLACKKCNGADQKGDKWPTVEEGGPLINPCDENPEDFFEFEFDEETLITIVKPKNTRAKTSESIYGLNKHSLLGDRNKYIRKLVFIAKRYHVDNEAKEIIDEALQNKGEYLAFTRMILSKYVE